MEACLLVCRNNKPVERKGKVLFINAVKEVARQSAYSQLEDQHIQKIYQAFKAFRDDDGFARVISNDEIILNKANLSITLYVSPAVTDSKEITLKVAVKDWLDTSDALKRSSKELLASLGDDV